MTIYIKADDRTFYRATVSPRWAEAHDNGALISLGLTVGVGGFTRAMLDGLIRRGQAVPVDEQTYQHSGCQSRCVRRGDPICQW